MMNRLFVPLKTEPFNWFKSGNKIFELRNQVGQYNKNQIITGRKIELRRGYSTNDKLFGVIGQVVWVNEIDDLFNQINYSKIVPEALNLESAKQEIFKMLRNNSGFVAFEIILE